MKDGSSFWVEESSEPSCLPMKRKRQIRPKKLKFIGWGSKLLIDFLQSIGKDTSTQLNRYEVTGVINEYINTNNLANPRKKKKVLCDQWLCALFGKKSVSRIKVYDLLESHFAENCNSSEDDFEYSAEEQDGGTTSLENKTSTLGQKPSFQKKKVPETPKSCFAAICPENIKLVYLSRSLVQDLLKAPESFDDKVVGSFVRIKSDPSDYLQKNSHQLEQVVGVRIISEADGKEVHLQLSNCMKEIPIQMLSDNNFSEAECEDLRGRVKADLLRRPTVVEFEGKARMLHKDIMKHWIPRELAFLQNLIDRANEKGWRRELFQHLERRKLLEKSSEQERLLAEMPKVIADELEREATPLDKLEMTEENSSSPSSCNWEAADNYYSDDGGTGNVGITSAFIKTNSVIPGMENTGFTIGVTSTEAVNGSKAYYGISREVEEGSKADYEISRQVEEDCQDSNPVQNGIVTATVNGDQSSKEAQAVDLVQNGIVTATVNGIVTARTPTPVIELSDDEIEVIEVKVHKHATVVNPEDCVWLYLDPQGKVQGPFPLSSLKRWNDYNYFDRHFMVWKNGESQNQAVLLTDVLRRTFP